MYAQLILSSVKVGECLSLRNDLFTRYATWILFVLCLSVSSIVSHFVLSTISRFLLYHFLITAYFVLLVD